MAFSFNRPSVWEQHPIFDWNLAAHTVPIGKRLGLGERGQGEPNFLQTPMTYLQNRWFYSAEILSWHSLWSFFKGFKVNLHSSCIWSESFSIYYVMSGGSRCPDAVWKYIACVALWPRTFYAQRWSILNLFEFLKIWGKTGVYTQGVRMVYQYLMLSWAANSDILSIEFFPCASSYI